MNRQAQAAVLFLLGAALLHAGFTDLYLRYVKAGLQPLLLLSGAVLIAAALATVWYEWRGRTKRRHDEGVDHGDGDGHVHREPRVSWLLVLPLLALILVAPPALGSYSAMRTGTALQQPYGYDKLPAAGPLHLTVVDYATRAVYDHGRSLKGRRLDVTGFVALDGAGHPYLVRMALNCCAADAQPVKIALTGKIPPVLQPDKWLEVTGTYTARRTKDPVNNGPIPYLQVTEAKPVPVPKDPYDESWNK
ncbi:TIGR03943 family putative permease subunit [Streptomyces spinosisporus]|uniref:TIGR03943 family protein n=1 Tax=Streptomyces spinosisporus TaxID=2927582 RepID=A0ABS9XEV6_9ACTN|nr:TIGR03943 family protein [Streptomyces spinosisporus]MCI3240505.1 TIGR03943 family protein [Streptomyces spinosisporus]